MVHPIFSTKDEKSRKQTEEHVDELYKQIGRLQVERTFSTLNERRLPIFREFMER